MATKKRETTVGRPETVTLGEPQPFATFKYGLGVEVVDKISGFIGIVSGRSQFLNGCIRYLVEPRALKKDGGLGDAAHFDEGQLEATKGKPVVVSRPAGSPPGGPRADISRGPDISR